MYSNDRFGRAVGIIVFLAGIAVLITVFVIAYGFFGSNTSALHWSSQNGVEASPTSELGESAVQLLARIAALIVMAVVGSLVSNKGIQLYFRSGGSIFEE